MRNIITGDSYGGVEQTMANRDAQEASNFFNALMADRAAKSLQSEMDQRGVSNQLRQQDLAQNWMAQANAIDAGRQQREASNKQFEWAKQMGLMDYNLKQQQADAADQRNANWDSDKKTQFQYGLMDAISQGKLDAASASEMDPSGSALYKAAEAKFNQYKTESDRQSSGAANLLNSQKTIDDQLAALGGANAITQRYGGGWFGIGAQPDKKEKEMAQYKELTDKRNALLKLQNTIASKPGIYPGLYSDQEGKWYGPNATNAPSVPAALGPSSMRSTGSDPRVINAWSEGMRALKSGWTKDQVNKRLSDNGIPPLPNNM